MLRLAPGGIEDSFSEETKVRTRGFWCVWITAWAFFFGLITFWSGQSWFLSAFLPAAYLAIVVAFVRTIQAWRDPFNPLCLVLIIGLVRFLVPGFLILNGAEPEGEVMSLFQSMKLSDSDWEGANVLALV